MGCIRAGGGGGVLIPAAGGFKIYAPPLLKTKSGVAPANQTKEKGQFMNFSQGHSGTIVRYVNRACFPKEKHTRIHKKMGEIHELFVLAFSLVWFAGATPDKSWGGERGRYNFSLQVFFSDFLIGPEKNHNRERDSPSLSPIFHWI